MEVDAVAAITSLPHTGRSEGGARARPGGTRSRGPRRVEPRPRRRDSNKRRHTSFSSVWVYPEIDENIEVEINPKDLRIDTYRASGAGGQHVNKTDSAVRITHLKYNVVVQSQNERSQHRNRDTAMKMLKSRIYEIELEKQNEEKKKDESNKKEIGWGNQIRSYVLHPYKMVKDLRTNHQTSNTEAVLDGSIFDFLEASLLDD